MAKLNYMDRDNLLKEFEIQEDLITLGREATNKLVVADPSVSRQHAWVERREDGYYLVDKNSSNGTFINGKKVTTEQKLMHNDKISLGNASLVFEDEEQVQATFILPRKEVPLEQQDTEPSKKERTDISPGERPTAAVDLTPPPRPAPVLPPAPPTPPPPAAPRPPVPPPQAAAPAAGPQVCPSCKKPVEASARFCGSCGAPIAAAPRPAAPAPPPPAPSAQPSRPPMAPPPPAAPRPAVPPPPPTPAAPRPAAAPVPPPPMGAPGMPPAPAPMPRPAGSMVYAGFGPRLLAYLIDSIILGLLLLLPVAVSVFMMMRAQTSGPGALTLIVEGLCYLIMMVIALGYQVYFVGAKGATPGKRIMKLRIALPDGSGPVGYGKAFIRMIGMAISGMICYIGFLMILFDKETHRALHDKIAGTVVLREG